VVKSPGSKPDSWMIVRSLFLCSLSIILSMLRRAVFLLYLL
jgi:hypothetical protein